MIAGATSEPRLKSWRRHGPALWLLLILAFVAVERIRLLAMPLERDEGEFAYAGQLMLEGEPPYKLIYNMKMPGIYAAYALIMTLFGQTPTGIHLGFMLINFGAIVLMYFVGRRFLDQAGALAASAAYALLSLSPHVQGFNAHATHFVVLAALGAILGLLRAQDGGRLAGFFWSGALFGVGFLMKQPGGAFAVFGFSLLLWTACRRQQADWKTHRWRMTVYAAGVAAPIVLTGLVLWRAGVWDRFYWWTVTYAGTHATAMTWANGKLRLANFFTDWFWDTLFWIVALAGLICVLAAKKSADSKFFFLSLLFFSALAVCPTFHFTNHYFVLMLPVVALLAAYACTTTSAWLSAQPLALVRGTPWILFGLMWAGVAWSYLGVFVLWKPQEVAARIYSINDFQVYPVIAEHLARDLPAKATMAVFGSEPELLFYAHRRSVTGYIYMYDLVQDQPFRERMEKEMLAEVDKGRPDYVVFVNLSFSWLPRPPENIRAIQDWLAIYTASQYEPYGAVTFGMNQYIWGHDCLQLVPPGHRFVVIYRRKSAGAGSDKISKSPA
jgi:4-amino-4-deoxy-L-arabinose transferase-like glycosyltransferase